MEYPNTEIEKCTAVKDTRHYLNNVHLDVENSRLIAASNHIGAVLPVRVDPCDTSGPITAASLKAARKLAKRNDTAKLNAAAALSTEDGATLPRPDHDYTFPDINRVIPERNGAPDIALNAELLMALQSALTDKGAKLLGLKFYFGRTDTGAIDPTKPVRVEPLHAEDDRCGVIMPMRL